MEEVKANDVELNGQLLDAMEAYDKASEQYKNEVVRVKTALEQALYKALPANSQIQYSSVEWDWNCVTEKWYIRWRCEVINTVNSANSGFHVYFSADDGVEINNACIGSYNKNERGYIAAIRAMAAIWDNVDSLEEALRSIDTSALLAAKEQKFQAEAAKAKIESQLEEIRTKELAKEILAEGTEISLRDDCWDNLFHTRVRACVHSDGEKEFLKAVVKHITLKKVLCTVTYCYYSGTFTRDVWVKKDIFLAAVTHKGNFWQVKVAK